MLAGVIAIDPAADAGQWMADVLAAMPGNHRTQVKTIVNEPFARCCWLPNASPHADLWQLQASDGRRIFVCGYFALGAADVSRIQGQVAQAPEESLSKLPGMWNALVVDPGARRVRLLSDRLGVAWLFLARRENALIFGNHFGAVAWAARVRPILDVPATLATLEMGYTPAPRTCLEGVGLVPGGRVVDVGVGKNETILRDPMTYGDAFARQSAEEKCRELDSRLDEAFNAWCRDDMEDVMSLSFGYDSPTALGVALRCGYQPRCVTFGFPRNLEVRGATRIAADAGMQHELYQLPEPSWDEYAKTISRTGVVGGQAYFHGWSDRWLEWARQRGRGMIIGFLGDSLSGKHLVGDEPTAEEWRGRWEAWSCDGGWDALHVVRPDARGAFQSESRREFDEILQGVTTALPHQVALHMDLFGRQPRLIAVQPNLVAGYLRPELVFYHPRIMEFWCNTGLSDLAGQRLYLEYAKSRFRTTFKEKFHPALLPGLRRVSERMLGRIVPPFGRWMRRPIDDRPAFIVKFRNRIQALIRRFSA